MDTLLVFVKRPRPGEVKTRLAAALGPDDAAALYRRLAEEVLRLTPARGAYRRLVFHAPADAGAEIAAWLPGETLVPQVEGDLGWRMAAGFEEAFRRGARRAAIVGTDVPALTRSLVAQALGALEDHDLVLGPARDGGYYLLAIDRPHPGLFQGIAWSTPTVLAATAERATGLGLGVRLLQVLRDVDTPQDVVAEWPRLAPLLPHDLASRVAAALRIGDRPRSAQRRSSGSARPRG